MCTSWNERAVFDHGIEIINLLENVHWLELNIEYSRPNPHSQI